MLWRRASRDSYLLIPGGLLEYPQEVGVFIPLEYKIGWEMAAQAVYFAEAVGGLLALAGTSVVNIVFYN